MAAEFDLPCRGANGEACAEMVHYKREAISGMWRAIVVYLTCKKGHTNAYEIPISPSVAPRAIRGKTKKKTSTPAKSRPRSQRRARRHER